MRIAEHLGMTRRRLLAETDAWELALWEAKWRIDGPMVEMQTARLLAQYVASKSGENQEIKRFLPPQYQAPEKQIDPEEQMRQQKAVIAEYKAAIGL